MTGKHDQKILPLEQWKQNRAGETEPEESSLRPLLEHMRKVRESVPVNNRLKEELRKQLFERQNNCKDTVTVKQVHPTRTYNRWFVIAGIAVLLVTVLALILWQQGGMVKRLGTAGEMQEVTRYWVEEEPLQPALSPDGKYLLLARSGCLLWLDEKGIQQTLLIPQPGDYYHSPAWTPDGKNITLVKKNKQGYDEIIQYEARPFKNDAEARRTLSERLAREKPSLLYRGRKGETISNLHWSPGGKYLGYIIKAPRQESVVVIRSSGGSTRSLGAGTFLTWAPDGSKLVVERQQKESELWLVSLNGQEKLLGNGKNPVWSEQGYLVFTDIRPLERILTYLPDGKPQFTVQQKVGEIRWVQMGRNGQEMLQQIKAGKNLNTESSLLLNFNNEKSFTELEWLRQMESEGIREPRVLLLDEVDQNTSQCFGPGSRSLYFTRESGKTVSIMRVKLQEQKERQGD